MQAGHGFDQDFQDFIIFRMREFFLIAKAQRRKEPQRQDEIKSETLLTAFFGQECFVKCKAVISVTFIYSTNTLRTHLPFAVLTVTK